MMHTKSASTSSSNHSRGSFFESLASNFLSKKGLIFIEKNFRTKLGEIDLIFKDKCSLVFVEVKFRRNDTFGSPTESINAKKIQRIKLAAEVYIQTKCLFDLDPRFDVIGITPNDKSLGIEDKPDNLIHATRLARPAKNFYQFDWIKEAF